jgi:hypothetical protein
MTGRAALSGRGAGYHPYHPRKEERRGTGRVNESVKSDRTTRQKVWSRLTQISGGESLVARRRSPQPEKGRESLKLKVLSRLKVARGAE